jgi:isoleucyl-tRNA synthetase
MLIERTPRRDTVVESGDGLAVALDTRLTDQLLLEGIARELISRVQRMRRDHGLDVTDRIKLSWWSEDPTVREAITTYRPQIASEVLAESIEESSAPLDGAVDLVDRRVGLQLTV